MLGAVRNESKKRCEEMQRFFYVFRCWGDKLEDCRSSHLMTFAKRKTITHALLRMTKTVDYLAVLVQQFSQEQYYKNVGHAQLMISTEFSSTHALLPRRIDN